MVYAAHSLLDFWRAHTWAVANETIPFCSEYWDCYEAIHDLIRSSSRSMENALIRRTQCTYNVEVPAYFLNATTHEPASEHVALNRKGNLLFTKGVCTCDSSSGLGGVDCLPTTLGIVYNFLSVFVLLWIGYLFVWALMTLAHGHFKSVAKQKLACIALIQFVSQMLWISGMVIFPLSGELEARDTRVGIGFGATSLGLLLFSCGMTVSVCNFVREGCNDASINERLKYLANVFRVAPVIVGVANIYVYFNHYTSTTPIIFLVLFTSVSLFISMSYSYCMNVLNHRVLRLIPRDVFSAKKTHKKNIWTMLMPCVKRANEVQPMHISKAYSRTGHSGEVSALLRTSQRLQSLASSQRHWLHIMLIHGIVFAISRVYSSANFNFLEGFLFLEWHVTMAIVPMLGLGQLSVLSPANAVRKLIATKGENQTNGLETEDVYSTDVGTLGS